MNIKIYFIKSKIMRYKNVFTAFIIEGKLDKFSYYYFLNSFI